MRFADGKLYFTAEGYKVIGRYDPQRDEVDWLLGIGQDGIHMFVFSEDHNTIFTANRGSDTVTVVEDVAGGPPNWRVTTIPVGGDFPEGIDLSPDGREVWTATRNDGGVSIIDVATKALKRFSDSPCTAWARRGTSACTNAGGPMQAYSMDLRERALLDSDAGMKAADVAVKYRVSGSWVRLLKQRRRETGEVAPRVQRHGRRRMLEPHLHTLAALIAEQPDRTLAELKDALGTPASLATIWRAVAALDVTVKKKRSGPPNTIDLTSRPRGSCGTPPRRPGIRHVWFFSMKPALRTISCGGMVGPSAGPASTTTRRAPGGRPVRFSQRCG